VVCGEQQADNAMLASSCHALAKARLIKMLSTSVWRSGIYSRYERNSIYRTTALAHQLTSAVSSKLFCVVVCVE
jgi:hypothetical protein